MRKAHLLILGMLILSLVPGGAILAGPVRVPATQATRSEPLPAGATVETVTRDLGLAVALVWDPDGRLFFTQKDGAVRLLVNGALRPRPVMTFAVDTCSERGLLGIELDPQFRSNHYVYVYYTAASNCSTTTNRVVRFVERDGVGSDPVELFRSPQVAGNHDGGNLHFGPDGKLYISVGDNANAANAQDVTVKNGKLHRINADGSLPADNPRFAGAGALPSLFAIGLRNSFDFTFDPVSGGIFASENGPGCDDELNRLVGGYNYGWHANYACEDDNPPPALNTIPPLWYIPERQCCIAPTGIEVYRGTRIPAWQNDLFMCNYNNHAMIHFVLNADRTQVTQATQVQGIACAMDVLTGPDGALYYLDGGGYVGATLRRIVGGSTALTATPWPPTVPPPTLTAPPATATPLPTTPAPDSPLIALADPLFYAVWERTDRPVAEGRAARSWAWGPTGRAVEHEPFSDTPRLVQYFDKARMERNPATDGGPAYVTNGLLVVELLSGRIQVGPQQYEARSPAPLLVGGDGADNPAPSYAALARVASLAGEHRVPPAVDAPVTARLGPDGPPGPPADAPPVRNAVFVPETGHHIPDVFYTFLTAKGPVYQEGQYQNDTVLRWVFTVGYPISEAYWTQMRIGGTLHTVLVQAYQRQVLTYIPDYPPPWNVQFGNVGIQYYQWRYGPP